MRYIIVGSGIWGCVIAERISNVLGEPVTIVEKRGYIGGNCYSFVDDDTGIECHAHCSHIFHTSIKEVFDYISKFCQLNNYRHKVLTRHNGRVYHMPINLSTLNNFYGTDFPPQLAEEFIRGETQRYASCEPKNLEEKAISLVGRPLYEAFIKNYTMKQWGYHPRELPQNIINRLPFRFDYNHDYFNDIWQGIPSACYFNLFKNLTDNPRIEIILNTDFLHIKNDLATDVRVIYTGLPDRLFNYAYGELDWRSLSFDCERFNFRDFQGTSVINYADSNVDFTRIHEFKHYHPEWNSIFMNSKTIICREYPKKYKPGDEAYYPINNERNNELYKYYSQEARKANIILGGRLGTYRYLDMDKAISDALNSFKNLSSGFV